MVSPSSSKDLAAVGRVFLEMVPFLRTRLYGSAVALTPMFRALLGGEVDALVLFAKPVGEINPRQSFRWNSQTLSIETFEEFTHVANELGISMTGSKTAKDIYAAVNVLKGRYVPLTELRPERTVHIFVSDSNLSSVAWVFFDVVRPYLEMFRTSTIHALNDLYRTREDDLKDIVEKMTPSTAGTVFALLKYLSDQSRFGQLEATAWEFEQDAWNLRSAPEVAGHGSADIQSLLDQEDSKKLLGGGKTLAVDLGAQHAVVIPFACLRDELLFQKPITDDQIAMIKPVARSRRLRSGDWAIALLYHEPPHANVVHSLVHYRQFYFDTFRPQLLKHVHQIIYDRASGVQAQYALGRMVDDMPDFWRALTDLCREVLPTIYQALDVSGGVSVYRASDHRLEALFSWDEPGARRRTDMDCSRLSLQKGQRGVAATTFLEPKLTFMYCRDVENLERVGNAETSYIKLRNSTRSEYCHKLNYKATPIGVINFESARVNGFSEANQREIKAIVAALEHYLREFLAAQDSHWLAITAAAYHNLHELRQQAKSGTWGNDRDRARLLDAISAFDSTLDEGEGQMTELEDHFHSCLDLQLHYVPSMVREQVRQEAESRTYVELAGRGKPTMRKVSRLRLELLKRITTNLMSNFDIAGESGEFDSFFVAHGTRPYDGIRFWQQQAGSFPESWVARVGFAPLRDELDEQRAHHGLFLCGAIARSLGGFLWADNRRDDNVGHQSVIEIVVPTNEMPE